MNRLKCLLLTSVLATGAPFAAQAFGVSLSLTLPAPKVAVTQALSPGAVAAELGRKGFRVQEMYRKGPAYAVTATGQSGNKVLLMVDGRSGEILGLNVLMAVVKPVPETTPVAVYIDDRHPFGAVVPAAVYGSWERYDEPQWEKPAPALSISASFAPFQYAVPQRYVHASPKTGKSFAIAPPKYRGMKLQDHSGQEIRAAETRAEAADAEAAYQSERADEADFDRINAEQDAADARGEAADANADADEMARQADEANRRAAEAEQQRDEVQKQLDEKNAADQPCPPAECGPDVNSPPDSPAPPAPAQESPEPAQPPAAEPTEPTPPPAEAPTEPAQPPAAEPAQPPAAEPAEPAAPETQEPVTGPEQQDQREERAPEAQPQEAPPEPQQEESQPEPDQGGGSDGGGDSGGGDDGN